MITQYNTPGNREARLERVCHQRAVCLDKQMPCLLVDMTARAAAELQLAHQEHDAELEALRAMLRSSAPTSEVGVDKAGYMRQSSSDY